MKFIVIVFLAIIQLSFATTPEAFFKDIPENKSEAKSIKRKLMGLGERDIIEYVNQTGFDQLTENVKNFYTYTGFQNDEYEEISGIFNFIMGHFKESRLAKDNQNAFTQFCTVCNLGVEYIKINIEQRSSHSKSGIVFDSPTKTTKIDYASSQMPVGFVFEDFSMKAKPVMSYNKTYNGRK